MTQTRLLVPSFSTRPDKKIYGIIVKAASAATSTGVNYANFRSGDAKALKQQISDYVEHHPFLCNELEQPNRWQNKDKGRVALAQLAHLVTSLIRQQLEQHPDLSEYLTQHPYPVSTGYDHTYEHFRTTYKTAYRSALERLQAPDFTVPPELLPGLATEEDVSALRPGTKKSTRQWVQKDASEKAVRRRR